MRTFYFKARNIGEEKYLTYTMGAECELDEDVLDYCEENNPGELLNIIYEEDDDYDYLTYDITDRTSLEEFIKGEVDCQTVLFVLRNVADGLISLKEQAIPLSYVLLNKEFIYINKETKELKFICLPIESKGSLAVEFKSFVRQLLANMKYDVDEDLNYVGKLLTYINGDNFNLRGLIGLAEALMEEEGISFEAAGAIDADGVEVVSADTEPEAEKTGIMDQLDDSDDAPLPEIGDDEEDGEAEAEEKPEEEELDSILPAGMKPVAESEEEELDSILPAGMKPATEPEETEEDNTEIPVADIDEKPVEPVTEEAVEKAEPVIEEAVEKVETVQEIPVVEAKKPVEEIEEIPAVELAPQMEAPKEEIIKMKPQKKEADIDVIKDRIKELVGEVPSAKPVGGVTGKKINTLEDLDTYLDSKPPVVKKNVVKVNRAAIIQQTEAEVEAAEAEERAANGLTENIKGTVEDITDDMNIEKKDDEKPKSSSVLSKTVAEVAKAATGNNVPKALPYLIRVSTEERIMLSKVTFKIGKATRGVDYTVGGNGAISRQHAIITQKDGVCYIKDNKSTNHTFVNGKVIEEGVEEILTHDSMIRLADEEFVFKIR